MTKTDIVGEPSVSARPEATGAGEIAARAFESFDRGMLPDEVVAEWVLPVDVVESLWRTWARLRGAVLLSAEAGLALREALSSTRPITCGGDAVAAVQRFVERPPKPCSRCKSAFREYCTTCPAREATRAARSRLGGATKRRAGQRKAAGPPDRVEPTPTSESGVLTDALATAVLAEASAPRSRPGEGSR